MFNFFFSHSISLVVHFFFLQSIVYLLFIYSSLSNDALLSSQGVAATAGFIHTTNKREYIQAVFYYTEYYAKEQRFFTKILQGVFIELINRFCFVIIVKGEV